MVRALVENRAVDRDDLLDELMKTKVTKALNIPEHIVFGSQSSQVFRRNYDEFMKPAIHIGLYH